MTKSNFFLKVNDKDFNVTYLHGYEKINKGFSYSLTVESSVKNNTDILLANASVIFVNKNKRYREQCGLITSVTNMGVFNNLHRFKINIQDRLSTLKDTSNSKVFIAVNVQDVLNYLAQKAGYSSGQIVFRTSSALPHLKQCVQAMESDWAFFNRLMSQHGLFYWIESESNTETLVISDSNLNSPYLSTGVLEVKANAGMNAQYWGNFVGFMHSEVTQTLYNNAAQSNAHGQFQKVASNSQSFFEPAANSDAEASAQTQSFSNALATHNKLVTLTGNVSDVFAGCSISLDDNMGFASGDLLCIAIEHTLNQANDESSHEGETHYHCVAQFIERGTPYKAMPEPHTPKPMVFPATVESLTSNAFVDEHGQYRIRTEFDKTARPVIQSSPALKKLALYACENQPQATGWHFPLVGGSEVLIGCINNDPNNTFIMGFALNADQPSVVTAANPTHNRLLSAAQNELMFDDDKDVPKVILQTLASEHYIELNAIKSGRQFIQWISQLGTINLHAGRDLCLETEQNNVQFVIKNNQFIDVKNTVSQTTNNSHVNYQSGGSQAFSGKNATLTSENEISLLTGRAVKVHAQSDILLKTNNSDLKLNVPNGSTFLQTNNNISITGSGNGDLIIHNAGGEIKLDSQGNVDITATNVLTLDGTFITFDGPVDYDITSPQTARAPSNASPANISQVTAFDLSDSSIKTNDIIEYSFSSSFAREQLYLLAEQIAEVPFITSMAATFGSDIPIAVYQAFYRAASDKQLPNIEIKVEPHLIYGHLAAFDNTNNCILLTNPLIEKALADNEGKALMLSALLEEYGHGLDYYLRNTLSKVGGDAKQDEGAIFAYRLLDLELFQSNNIEIGNLSSPDSSGPLVYDNANIANMLNNVNQEHQTDDGMAKQLEFFGAGTGDDKNPASYGHRSIEFVLADLNFDPRKDLPIIYFGNWLRDFSQFIDPAIVRPSKDVLKRLQNSGHLKPELDTIRLSRNALTELVAILALKEFSRFGEDIGKFCYKHVTPQTLGVYRAEEHMDNPKSETNGQFDNSIIDSDFAKPYIESQIAINPLTGLKNYINTPVAGQTFDTAVQYMTAQLKLAMQFGDTNKGKIHFGQALHVLEDYFSHSNFIEVSIIKLGQEGRFATEELNQLASSVYPVVDLPNKNSRIPIVTGRFGQTDVLASIGPKMADLFQDSIEEFKMAKPGVRTASDIAIKVILADLAASQTADTKKDNTQYQGLDFVDILAKYEQFLSWRDELTKAKNDFVADLILKMLHYSSEIFILVSSFAIHHIIETVSHQIDDAQTLISKTGTDPTHSQLAKDHDVHPFHEIAALVAQDAVSRAGKSIKFYWEGSVQENPLRVIPNIIQHPDFHDLFEERIILWVNNNKEKVKKGTYKTSVDEVHDHFNEQSKTLKEKINQTQSNFTTLFRDIYDYFN
ncbi:HET-C-related protein [Pseudoalteromonas arctica]|uniref:HET-C-related protein n=1 Tax=Pseudoalteromonas arctica TaxID=394751 RepID=UPI002495A294|nr:HET-C-related protein [Pseudoalteromonas arctica]